MILELCGIMGVEAPDPDCCTDCGRKVAADKDNPLESFTWMNHVMSVMQADGTTRSEGVYAFLCQDCVEDLGKGVDHIKWFDLETKEVSDMLEPMGQ